MIETTELYKLTPLIMLLNQAKISYNITPNKNMFKDDNDVELFLNLDKHFSKMNDNDLYTLLGLPTSADAKALIRNNKIDYIRLDKDNRVLEGEYLKNENLLKGYYEFYNKNSQKLNSYSDILRKVHKKFKVETNKQVDMIKTHQAKWDRVNTYLSSSNIINSVATSTSNVENVGDVKTITNKELMDNMLKTSDDIGKYKKSLNIADEVKIEKLIADGFNQILEIENLVENFEEIKNYDDIDDKIQAKNDKIQRVFDDKAVQYETELNRIVDDLIKHIDKLIEKLIEEKNYVDFIKEAYEKIINSKMFKAIYDTLNDIPFFKNFFDAKDDLKDISKDVIKLYKDLTKSMYISNRVVLNNKLNLVLLNDDVSFLNYGTGYWNNQILFDNLNKDDTNETTQDSVENTLNKYKSEGNSTVTPVHPFIRQFVKNSKISTNKLALASGHSIILILDRKVDIELTDVVVVTGEVTKDPVVLGGRETVNVKYKLEGDEDYKELKLFIDSYRLWSEYELSLYKTVDEKYRTAYVKSLMINYKSYTNNNKNENVKEQKDYKGTYITEKEEKEVKIETLNKNNFDNFFKKATHLVSAGKSSYYIKNNKLFNIDNEQFLKLYDSVKNRYDKYIGVINNIKADYNVGNDSIENVINTINNFPKIQYTEKLEQNYNQLKHRIKIFKNEIESGKRKGKNVDDKIKILNSVIKSFKAIKANRDIVKDYYDITKNEALKTETIEKFNDDKSKIYKYRVGDSTKNIFDVDEYMKIRSKYKDLRNIYTKHTKK